jgi:hypothetical protein
MLHNPCLLQKVVFLASKTLLSPIGTGKKTFSSILNFMISRMGRNKCVKFGGHVYRQVNYKILQSKVPNTAQTCAIYLAFDRGCFEAILIEITHKTLGKETTSKLQIVAAH